MGNWTLDDIPNLTGRVALVTGGNVGLGFRSALELARRRARVFIACRRPDAGTVAAERIAVAADQARPDVVALDLTDAGSIERCAATVASETDRLDILLNNAGVVNLESLQRTRDGHEMHMAVNHYGHFALTGRLFGLLDATPGARVVTVSSAAWRTGAIDFDDLDWRRRPYSRTQSYSDSKLANLLFTRALQVRFDAAAGSTLSVAAHPGLAGTERQQSIGIGGVLAKWIAAPVERAVCPQLRAATDPGARPCDFYGPRFGLRGPARRLRMAGEAEDDALAERLWRVTEGVTEVFYPAPG